MAWFDWLVEPFQHNFMQTALITAILVGSVCALLSCYLVLKGWSLMGDAISHSVLPGVVVASLLNTPLSLGAFLSGLCCAMFVGYIKEHSRLKEDTIMGIIFSGMFALGLVLFTAFNTGEHLTHILFGNLLGITHFEYQQLLISTSLIMAIVLIKRKDFLLYCFDYHQAKAVGLSTKQLHYGLLSLLALTIISAMQVVGVILVVAMLITPGISAFLLTKRFDRMLLTAVIISVIASLSGTILSYHLDSATGPTIILLQAVIFLTIFTLQYYRKTA